MHLSSQPGDVDKDRALRQYTAMLGYLQYENSVYWTRSQFFIVAHAALLGLLIKEIPDGTAVSWVRLVALAVASIVGLVLAHYWLGILRSAEAWIERWHGVLVALEPDAMDDKELFRNVDKIDKKYRIKHFAKKTTRLFQRVWLVVTVYLGCVALVKLNFF